jgi:uncharacterized FlaG/YvyC family protein
MGTWPFGRLPKDGDMDISSAHIPAQVISAPAELASPHPINQDQRNLIQSVKAVNASEFFGQENELTFILDRATRRAVVRLVSRKTGEVVEQIPAEYVLRMAEELKGTQT